MAKIVAAIDGSTHSLVVLEWALDHARVDDDVVAMLIWNLTAVGGFESPFGNLNESQLSAVRTARSIVEVVRKRREAKGRLDTSVAIDVQHGDPSTLLIRASETADVIVLGGFRSGHMSIGSVTRKVVARARCAVTLVPLTLGSDSGQPETNDASIQS